MFIAKVEALFEAAAKAWENGNNGVDENGTPVDLKLKGKNLAKQERLCVKFRKDAEKLLKPLRISVDYPGLYPSFNVNGADWYDVRGAVNAALRERIFMGVVATGISYADRQREVQGDYKRLGNLFFDDLRLTLAPDCPEWAVEFISTDAASIQARKGEKYQTSGSGQYVTLGNKL